MCLYTGALLAKFVQQKQSVDGWCVSLYDESFIKRETVVNHLLDGDDCETAFMTIQGANFDPLTS